MMVHVAVMKTYKKFEAMTYEEQVKNYEAFKAFLSKYATTEKHCESEYIKTPERIWSTYTFDYVNKKGEAKTICVTMSLYEMWHECSLGFGWCK